MATADGVITCENCGSVYRQGEAAQACVNCGAPLEAKRPWVDSSRPAKYVGVLAFLKPVGDAVSQGMAKDNMLRPAGGPSMGERVEGPITCGWCTHRYKQRPAMPNCENCGGVLPKPPGSDPGDPPPAPPRRLPRQFFWQLYGKQNLTGLIGLGAFIIGVPCLFFPIIGVPLLLVGLILIYSGFATARLRHVALARGQHVPGVVESVERIGQGQDNTYGSVLYRVWFRFDSGGQAYRGMKYTYDAAITRHFQNEPVWVVCLPKSPKHYDIWPPLA